MAEAEKKKKVRGTRHVSALKRNRQNTKARARNAHRLHTLRTAVKKVRAAIVAKNAAAAQTELKAAISMIHKTASKGVIPKQRASRTTSRLTRAVQALQA